MVRSRTKLLDRVLAVTLAVIMLLAMIPMSTLTAFAVSYEAGSDCQNACGGKLEWVENSTPDGTHYLVCDNDACEKNDISNAVMTHTEGRGAANCLICNPPHAHGEFVYSLENENKTIVATCGSAGTCDLADGKVSITIVAPSDLTYDGAVKSATINGVAAWKAATGNDAPQITYNKEPKTVGSYTASITVDDKTASVGFEIVKGTPSYTVPTGLTAKYGQILADVQLPAGFAWNNEEASVGDIGVNTFKASFTPTDTDNYNVVENIDVQITVGRAASVIAAPSISGNATQTSITVNAITPTVGDGTVEYGYIKNEADKNDPSKVTNWQTETTFDGLEGSTTYYFYARISETANYAAAVSSMATISTAAKRNGELTISIDDWTYGEIAVDPDFDIKKGDYGIARIEYATKGETNWSENVPTNAGEYTVRVYCEATATYAEAVMSCDFKIKQKEVTVEWSNTTLTYNAENQKPTAVITAGVVRKDDVTVVVTGAQNDAGDNYTATAVLDGTTKDNYVINTNKTQLFNIDEKEVAITWANTTLIHNTNQQKPTATINEGEIFAGDVVSVEVSGAKKRPGQYTATASLIGEDAANYIISETEPSSSSKDFTISNLTTPTDPFTIVKVSDGTIANANANHWYNYDIKIIPKEGYTIGTADDSDEDFSGALIITESKQDYKVFLRDENGSYTGEISIGNTFGNVDGNINIDKDPPEAYTQINGGTLLDIFLETVTFGIYHKDEVTVTLSGKDENSTVDHIYYYKLEKNRLSNSDLFEKGEDIPSWTEGTTVTVDVDNDYVVYVKVVDKAGNISYASTEDFVFDATEPVVEVTFINNEATNEKYFIADREVEIKITEHNFDPAGVELFVTEGGVDTSSNYALNWNTVGDVHTATITFVNEADYTFGIHVTDKANNSNDGVNYGSSVAPEKFTIDKTRPNASLVIEGLVKDAPESWKETWKTADDTSNADDNALTANVLTSIDYNNRWTNANAKVSATSDDNLSGVDYIEYFRTENIVADITDSNITWSNSTKALTDGRDEFKFEVEPNEKFIVYAHIVDKAGNDIYMSSNGVIVDDKAPGGDNYSPEVDITLPKANDNGIYNEDDTVKVDFKVVEPKYSGANTQVNTGIYSGIKEVKYVIKAEDINAVEEQIFDLTNGSVKDANGLIGSWTGSITIDKEKFNSNNVIVMITAIDNAGNVHTSTTKIGDIKIDVTAPVIDIEYDNNAADSTSFFKDKRIAKVVITERNFKDNDDIIVTITNTDGTIPSISAFSKVEGTDGGNGDNTQWEATIVYEADGDYTFAIEYTDLAGNGCKTINYAEGTTAPNEFTIDRTVPIISVVYDNNNAANGNYYKADRTATITITEHNFDSARVKVLGVATDNGSPSTFPTESKWISNGDVHAATISYTADSKYTFDIEFMDKAGNSIADFTPDEFYIDKTNPTLQISGIVDKSANNKKGNIGYVITGTDTNFNGFTPVLSAVVKNEENNFETKTLDAGQVEAIANGQRYTLTNIDTDGVYSITCTFVDMAGNEFSEVILEDANGKTYTEKRSGKDKLVEFSVNRNGSTFIVDEYTKKLLDNYYVQKVTSDVTLTEINADSITENTVTLNGKELAENTDYTVSLENSEGGWYRYTYSINKKLFDTEGEYNVIVSSKDKATNDAFSDVKGATVNFVVDRTAPVITVTGMAVNGRYQTESQKVTLIPTDDGGALKSLIVRTVDDDGKQIKELVNLSGEALIKALEENSGKIEFNIAEGLYQNIQIICNDSSAGEDGKNNMYDKTFTNVSVSSSGFMIFWANKPLRWGSMAGVMILAAAIVFFITYKKRKNK